MERKPPVTLLATALMCGLHYQKTLFPANFRHLSLCPNLIVQRWDWMRLIASGFLHVDDMHLYHNMVSFLWKGYHLEWKIGSVRFAFLVAYLLLLSHAFVVIISLLMATIFQMPDAYHQCALGFSAVLFALKVVLNHGSPTFTSVHGFQVPTKYAAWLELVVIHILVPRSSFLGHMCGILAGYVFVLWPRPQQLTAFLTSWTRLPTMSHSTTNRRTFNSSGSTGQRTRQSASAHRFESDEELARRLQEEEIAAASLSADELRRRRLSRFTAS
ncbi:TPA: hypothetical protein N0F65_009432 [Lagenidium giganteum]|uniref:Peptidase S54 rhomboid domain-containing protein n=1 Tax=Lagenidium giganteum TaxID=4803 RepID=A0AAV2ZJA0_9STRA|nr:TPA: hypothetical protein N0F65_009432 [Lagenidium giganteum]